MLFRSGPLGPERYGQGSQFVVTSALHVSTPVPPSAVSSPALPVRVQQFRQVQLLDVYHTVMPSRRVPGHRAGLSRRPLTTSEADQALFVNRTSEVHTIVSSVELGLNAFVSGTAGSGKTSLLRHVERTLESGGTAVVYVNVGAAQSVGEAIGSIARAIATDNDTLRDPIAEDETDVLAIEQAAARQPLVLLVDGVDEMLTVVLFGRYRDRLWESPNLTWVVASRHRAPAPPADAFFDRILELGPFTPADGAALLDVRAPWMPAETREHLVAAIGPAQPVFWMLAAQSLAIAETEPDTMIAALVAQQDIAEGLPNRLRVLYEALVELGPAHAGDAELLDRVGASRPWVATGLKELEELGLVRSERDGRRMLYETLRNRLVHSAAHGTSPLAAAVAKGRTGQ